MKSTFLLSLFILAYGINKAQQSVANHLVYKTTITKSNMSLVKVGPLSIIEIEIAPELITKKTTFDDPKLQKYAAYTGDKFFDLKNKLVLNIITISKNYYLEELDSFCRESNFVATGEKKKINGYDCELYKVDSRLKTRINSNAFFVVNKTSDYLFNVWITKDIQTDKTKNLYVSSCLSSNFANIPFEGTIVKVEGTTDLGKKEITYEIVLEKADTKSNVTSNYDYPWTLDFVPYLPGVDGATVLTESGETIKDQYKRIAAKIKDLKGIDHKKGIKVRDVPGFNAFYHMN
jgi:hypothetical protein